LEIINENQLYISEVIIRPGRVIKRKYLYIKKSKSILIIIRKQE